MKKRLVSILIILVASVLGLSISAFAATNPLASLAEPIEVAPGYYLVQVNDELGDYEVDYSYEFDAQGNMVYCLTRFRNLETDEYRYTYDEEGNLSVRSYVCRYTDNLPMSYTYYTYDERGRLTKAYDQNDDLSMYNFYTYSYDPSGRLVQVKFAREAMSSQQDYTIDYTYDELGQLVSISQQFHSGDINKFEFSYNEYGKIKQKKTYEMSFATRGELIETDTMVYEYDANMNNVKATVYNGAGSLTAIYEFVYEKLGPALDPGNEPDTPDTPDEPDAPDTPDEPDEPEGFTDVPADAYYADAVAWAVEHRITTGTSDTTFGPDDPCTRAQVVTFLWRAFGEPEPTSENNPFTDVDANQFYYKAVLWAVENGITTGTSETTFSPNAPCNRGQVVTFLWRAEGKPIYVMQHSFTDVTEDDYFFDAVIWAVCEGITFGTSDTTFGPNDPCIRSQVVTFLWRDMAE